MSLSRQTASAASNSPRLSFAGTNPIHQPKDKPEMKFLILKQNFSVRVLLFTVSIRLLGHTH
jgi:hypothetical protein